MSTFDPILSMETVDKEQLKALSKMITPLAQMIIGIKDVEPKYGRGVLKGDDRCVWRKDRKRITICPVFGGGLVATCSNDIDPNCPELPKRGKK